MNPLIEKLSWRDPLAEEEKQFLLGAISQIKDVAADRDLVTEGSEPKDSILLLEGFAARYRHLSNGRRQIVAIHIPGDFVDLHSFLLKKMDHGVYAMNPCRVALVPHDRLREITERHPHLTRLLWLSTLIDAAIHREWLVGMGRRSVPSQIAHLLCELFVRLTAVGRTQDHSFDLPITQEELADALGLSTVHVNRSLQELRAGNLITWRGNTVSIGNWNRLQELAEFEPTYLSLEKWRR